MAHYRICCLGSDAVGKTALSMRFISNYFAEDYHSGNEEDSYRKQESIDDEYGLLEILDTTNYQDFRILKNDWISDNHGFLIIYSITSRSSFEQVSALIEQVMRVKEADRLPMILVGNKCDLEMDRKVSYQEGQDLARSFRSSFKETSAKTCVNVQDAFFDLVRTMRICPYPRPPPRISTSRRKTACVLL